MTSGSPQDAVVQVLLTDVQEKQAALQAAINTLTERLSSPELGKGSQAFQSISRVDQETDDGRIGDEITPSGQSESIRSTTSPQSRQAGATSRIVLT